MMNVTETAATVREFNVAGPCVTRGRLVRETAKFYVYLAGANGVSGPNAKMVEKRIAKDAAHIEPCRSCRDHVASSYPNGYEN